MLLIQLTNSLRWRKCKVVSNGIFRHWSFRYKKKYKQTMLQRVACRILIKSKYLKLHFFAKMRPLEMQKFYSNMVMLGTIVKYHYWKYKKKSIAPTNSNHSLLVCRAIFHSCGMASLYGFWGDDDVWWRMHKWVNLFLKDPGKVGAATSRQEVCLARQRLPSLSAQNPCAVAVT